MTQPLLFTASQALSSLNLFRQASPLVHCLTNDVVQTLTANVLLALGASPAMITEPQEVTEFSALADALLINVGTLTVARSEAMLLAVKTACQAGKPWVLDPVAVGGLTFRSDFCRHLLNYHPTVIRGNASEIIALAGLGGSGRGVDTCHPPEAALEGAFSLSQQSGAIVAVTGAVDYVTDGEQCRQIPGGSPLMTRVVGTGCALSAVVAGFAALPGEKLNHIASACRVMSLAGEKAASAASGPGSFTPLFLDALYKLDAEAMA